MNKHSGSTTQEFGASRADHLDLLVATAEIGLWELDLVTGSAKRNQRHDEIFGYAELLPEWTFEHFLTHVPEEAERRRITRAQEAALAANRKWTFETKIRRADGRTAWISAAGTPVAGDDGTPLRLIGHVIDITPFKRIESRLRLVTGELQHRVRNLLTVVRSMVRLAARRASSADDLRQALEAQLAALASTNELLATGKAREAAGVAEVIEAELAPFVERRAAVQVDCPPSLKVSGAVAETLALAVHELLTNALKHGALSLPEGALQIEVEALSEGMLRLHWREEGPVTAASGAVDAAGGFGRALLRQAVESHGRIDWELRPSGLHCVLELETGLAG